MSEDVRKALVKLVDRHGSSLAHDARRCEAWLSDWCPNCPRAIMALGIGVKRGVVGRILEADEGWPQKVLVAKLTSHLSNTTPIPNDLARWVVESWAEALQMLLPRPWGAGQQECRFFFGPRDPWGVAKEPTAEERRGMVSVGNPESPFYELDKWDAGAVLKMFQERAFEALRRPNHVCNELPIIFNDDTPKSYALVEALATTVELPLVRVGPNTIESFNELVRALGGVLAKEGVPLVPVRRIGYFVAPPCVVHITFTGLPERLSDGILSAIATDGHIISTESGRQINCKNVCWIIVDGEGRSCLTPAQVDYVYLKDVTIHDKLLDSLPAASAPEAKPPEPPLTVPIPTEHPSDLTAKKDYVALAHSPNFLRFGNIANLPNLLAWMHRNKHKIAPHEYASSVASLEKAIAQRS